MERAIERMMEADLVHFALEDIALKVTAIGNPSLVSDICSSEVLYMCMHWVCCVALLCRLYGLACFFLPSASLISMYIQISQ